MSLAKSVQKFKDLKIISISTPANSLLTKGVCCDICGFPITKAVKTRLATLSSGKSKSIVVCDIDMNIYWHHPGLKDHMKELAIESGFSLGKNDFKKEYKAEFNG